jgi:hypothetical protein
MKTAKTNQDKQREFRARRSAEGQAEVRGVFAPKVQHDDLKIEFRKIVEAKGKK